MEKVFLAYTYSVKDEYSAQQDLLLKRVRAILDAMNLLEFNGEVLGGGGLTDAIRERIDDCNALLAIILPHSNSSQELQGSKWVNDEFVYAKNQKNLSYASFIMKYRYLPWRQMLNTFRLIQIKREIPLFD
jgi:hypothetical protein